MCVRLLWVVLWLHYTLRQLHSSCLWQVSAVIWFLLSWDSGTYTVLRFTHSVASIPTVSSVYVEDWPQFFRDAGSPFTNLLHITQSVSQFSHSVASDSLQPRGLQHARPPCPSPTPRVHSDSCPLSYWCHPTISSCQPPLLPPSVFPSIWVFSNESVLRIRWPKYWSFSFNISPSNEYSGLISYRIDWLDLLAVQGTLKSLL